MLKTRILTASIILPLFLSALFYFQDIFWAIVLLALTVIGSREWSRLAQFSVRNTIIFMLLTTLLGGELLLQVSEAVKLTRSLRVNLGILLIGNFLIVAAPLFLKQSYTITKPIIWMLIGWILLLPTCVALYQLRAISPLLLLGLMATIWISDTAAYFTGRSSKAQASSSNQSQ